MSTENQAQAESAAPDEITIDTIKDRLVGTVKQLRAILTDAQTGLGEIQVIADGFVASGKPVQVKFGEQLLSHIEKAAAVLDVAASIDNIKLAWSETKVLVADMDSEISDIRVLFEQISSAAARNQIAYARPLSPIFPDFVDGQSDTFVCRNNTDAVRSRIKFIIDGGETTGVAVLTMLKTDSIGIAGINTFYFSDFFELCDSVHGRKLQLAGGSPDGVFVYRAVMQLAIDLADSLVSQFGSLDDTIFHGNTRGDGLRNHSEEIADPDSIVVVDSEDSLDEATDVDEDPEPRVVDPDAGGAFEVDASLEESADAAPDDVDPATGLSDDLESPEAVDELSDAFGNPVEA
jgi:hypothetical protein